MKVMVAIGLIGLPILLPINYTAEHNNDTEYGTMIELSAQDIDTPNDVLWAHFIVTLLFSFIFAAWAIGTARSIRGRHKSVPEAAFVAFPPARLLVNKFTWQKPEEEVDYVDANVAKTSLLAGDTHVRYVPTEGHEELDSAVLMLKGDGWHAYERRDVEKSLWRHFQDLENELSFVPAWIVVSTDARELEKLYQKLCTQNSKLQSLKARQKNVSQQTSAVEELRRKVQTLYESIHSSPPSALDFAFVGFENSSQARAYIENRQQSFAENIRLLPANVPKTIEALAQMSKARLTSSSSSGRRMLGWEPV